MVSSFSHSRQGSVLISVFAWTGDPLHYLAVGYAVVIHNDSGEIGR